MSLTLIKRILFVLDESWLEMTDEQLQRFLSDRYGSNPGNQVCYSTDVFKFQFLLVQALD